MKLFSFLLPSPKRLHYVLIISIVLISFGITVVFNIPRISAQQDSEYAIKAKDILSKKHNVSLEKLKVGNEREARYSYSGKKAYAVKFIDDKGNSYSILLDGEGKELNHDELVKEDLSAKQAKYGKFEPSFAEKISKENEKDKNAEDKPVKAVVSLRIPPFKPYERPDVKEKMTSEQIKEYFKKVDAYVISKTEPTVTKVKEKLKVLGYDVQGDTTVGSIVADVSPKVLKEIETWEEVNEIADGSKKSKPALETAGYSTGSYWVNGRGFNGTGIPVAQIESGVGIFYPNGRIALNNPYISSSGITQDTTYLGWPCDQPALHATAVAGAMRSLHNPHKGHSRGISLWASGSCAGLDWELENRATAAVAWGAYILNLSYVCSGGGCSNYPTSDDIHSDKIVFNNYRSIVVAAGNTGCGGDGKIYNTALGYNSITAGSYNDNDTISASDDKIHDCSSWVNPVSAHNDREKPEIVAPGKNITTLSNVSPWTTPTNGTSLAAPMVTAGLALLLDRNESLAWWPEALKALTIATANKNIDGTHIPSIGGDSKDGFGAVNFLRADDILGYNSFGSHTEGSLSCDTPMPQNITMNLTQGRFTRVAFVFDANPDYPNYANEPNMDFDIHIIDPNNNYVGSSMRYDSTVESISFVPTMSGNYRLEIQRYRCDPTYNLTWYSAAWSQ